MIQSRKQRLAALEQVTGSRRRPAVAVFLLRVEVDATPEEIVALKAAKAARRPILLVRGIAYPLDPSLMAVVDAVDPDAPAAGPIFDKVPMRAATGEGRAVQWSALL